MALLCMFVVRGAGEGEWGGGEESERGNKKKRDPRSKITKKNTFRQLSVKSPPMEDKTIASSDINFC